MNKQYLKEILRKTVQQVLAEGNSKDYKLSELTFDELQQIFPEVNLPNEAFHLPVVDENGKDSVVAIHNENRFTQYKEHILQNYGDITFSIDPNTDTWVNRIKLKQAPEKVAEEIKPGEDSLQKALTYADLVQIVGEVLEEDGTGYSKYLVSKDDPRGETSKFDADTLSKILTKIAKDIDERKLK